MKVIDGTTPQSEITLADALAQWHKQKGMFVQVFDGRCSIIVHGGYNPPLNTAAEKKGLDPRNVAGLYTLAEDNWGRWSTMSKDVEEVCKRAMNGSGEFHYFATVSDFARAALDNGWR